jgi:hypothetical protein
MAKQRPTWAKRMKELQQMERKNEKRARRAAKKEGEPDDVGEELSADAGPLDADARAQMFDGLF